MSCCFPTKQPDCAAPNAVDFLVGRDAIVKRQMELKLILFPFRWLGFWKKRRTNTLLNFANHRHENHICKPFNSGTKSTMIPISKQIPFSCKTLLDKMSSWWYWLFQFDTVWCEPFGLNPQTWMRFTIKELNLISLLNKSSERSSFPVNVSLLLTLHLNGSKILANIWFEIMALQWNLKSQFCCLILSGWFQFGSTISSLANLACCQLLGWCIPELSKMECWTVYCSLFVGRLRIVAKEAASYRWLRIVNLAGLKCHH